PKVPKTNGSNSKPKIAKSMISNKTEPGTSQASNTSVALSSSSLVDLRISGNQPLHSVNWGYCGVFSNLSLIQSLKDQILVMAPMILTAMASEQLGSGPKLQFMTPATSSSGLVSNPIPQQPFPVAAASRAVDLANSPVSTSIDQDAPSTKSPKIPHFHDDPLHEYLHEDSTSQGSSSNVRPIYTPFESLGRWTKDHPISNVIGDPSHFVSTRKQLKTDAMWCYFDTFLTSIEPKNFKQEMIKPS
ncbi:hypothetical protein Tco_1462241, partial [Tanacetum coccineum]